MENTAKSVIASPIVYLYSLCKPKDFIDQLFKTNTKIPLPLILIAIIINFIGFESFQYLSELSKINSTEIGVIYLLIVFVKIIYALSNWFYLSYLLQGSFVKHELREAEENGMVGDNYWHKEAGFFQVMSIPILPMVGACLIFLFLMLLKIVGIPLFILKICLVLLVLYLSYAGLAIIKSLYFKKSLFQTFLWVFRLGVLSFIYTLISLFGFLTIFFILFKQKKIKTFYVD